MPYATADDSVRLYYEEVGSGTPIVFVHEFSGDYRSWEPQLRYFSRRHRCITFSFRGYKPSDVPRSPAAYTYRHFMGDVLAVLDHLALAKAHVVGLSMGGYSALQVGLQHPQRALSLTLAGTGSGSERAYTDEFRKRAHDTAERFERLGSAEVARTVAVSPNRVSFSVRDPRGFREFIDEFAAHDAQGSAHTQRAFQGERPSIYDFEDDIRRLGVPTLIIVGDEDDGCIEPSLFLKRMIAPSGLAMFPKTGHVVNLEEPALFNQTLDAFLTQVEAGRWPPRDPRSIRKEPG
jgi:3-oxoadipate enol-lactonase